MNIYDLNTSLVNRRSSTNHHIPKNQKIPRKFQQRGQHISFDSTRKLFQNKRERLMNDMFALTIFSSFCLHSCIDFSRSRHFEQHHT